MSNYAHKDVVLRSFDSQGRPINYQTPDGTLVPLPSIIYSSGSAVSLTGTTAETAMASITIPANMLGASGTIIVIAIWSHTNSANNKTKRVKYGAFDMANAHIETTTASSRDYYSMHQRTTATQVSYSTSGFGNSANAVITGTVDSTTDQTLTITGQLALGTETLTLEAVRIEVYAS